MNFAIKIILVKYTYFYANNLQFTGFPFALYTFFCHQEYEPKFMTCAFETVSIKNINIIDILIFGVY